MAPPESFEGVLAFDESHRAKNLTLDKAEQRSSKTAYVSLPSRKERFLARTAVVEDKSLSKTSRTLRTFRSHFFQNEFCLTGASACMPRGSR